jgi:hypothetical protein
MVSRERVEEWLEGYERAWRTAGTQPLRELFTEDATYGLGPYEQPKSGLSEIAQMWDEEREGPDEAFTMRREILAVEGETAVARVEVVYGDPVRQEYRDIWVMRFADDGRCSSFEEWPFWPERPSHAGSH